MRLLAIAAGLSLTGSTVAATGQIPVAQLFSDPQHYGAQLSPDGRYVVVMRQRTASAVEELVVVDLDGDDELVLATLELGDQVHEVYWVGDAKLYYAYTRYDVDGSSEYRLEIADFQRGLGRRAETWQLGLALAQLFRYQDQHPIAGVGVFMLDPLVEDPDHVLMGVSGIPSTSVGEHSRRLAGNSVASKMDAEPRGWVDQLADVVRVVDYQAPRTCHTLETLAASRELDLEAYADLSEAELEELLRVPEYPHVIRVNIDTGATTLEVVNPGRVVQWFADHAGQVRVGISVDCEMQQTVHYRASAADDWRPLGTFAFDEVSVQPISFHPDGQRFYVLSDWDRDTVALQLVDPANRSMEVVYANDRYDLLSAIFPIGGGELIAAIYEADRMVLDIIDPDMRSFHEAMDARIEGRVTTASVARDWSRVLLASFSDADPGGYHLYETESGEIHEIFPFTDRLDDYQLQPMQPVEIEVRDGTRVGGYLTSPRDAIGPQPLVVKIHGGPIGVRDSWGFDPETQFLVDRGYAVLQVNYRGSGGYGRAFRAAGRHEWAGLIQDDIADAVRWSIAQGHADPERICIIGASFGGYAALMNPIRYPELYRCAVSWAGVTDLQEMIREDLALDPRAIHYHRSYTGDPLEDAEALYAASPLHRADEVPVPVFIAHGADDESVGDAQGRRMVDALRAAGRHGRALFQSETGHGMEYEAQRLQFYRELERFLAEHMGPPPSQEVTDAATP